MSSQKVITQTYALQQRNCAKLVKEPDTKFHIH